MVLRKMQPAGLTILILRVRYNGKGQLSRRMADGGSQVSQCWSGSSQTRRDRMLEHSMWRWIRGGDSSMNPG